MKFSERGDSIVEVIVAVALLAIVVGASAAGMLAASRHFGADPVVAALQQTVENETRVAQNVMKYQGASLQPTSIATTIPFAGASPIPAHVSLDITSEAGATTVTVTAQSDRDASAMVTLRTTLPSPQPLPSSIVQAVTAQPAPIGAQ
ncbi:MAG: hypothetical protein M3N13_01165 [Candidatus Eremiobacteraeota bacterium]|nr:hypothetical protein [Candidatus Eremiobacteraeota bacterium]